MPLPLPFALRTATLADVPAIRALIRLSAHALSAGDYTSAQVEGALQGAFGVDTQLLKDGTYFLAQGEAHTGAPVLAGCGGWSFRRTLFGGDARADRDPERLDPRLDAAKIRAFFVHPGWARRGVGAALLERCEQAALAAGFRRFELMATLPGVRLYQARGYVPGELIHWPLPNGLTIEFIPMSKQAA
ncbi:MAG TPA: GNAT family N-acetyltransferase [Steroidobacteraceae bacterium]|nr:GNAT family N-acetyltransferase [Steroidobacteraceae bacterium]